MAVLTIRHVDEAIKTALRVRAAREGVSMEEEARRILCDALSQQQEQMPLGQRLLRRFSAMASADFALPERHTSRHWLATRNTADFAHIDALPLIDPWNAA